MSVLWRDGPQAAVGARDSVQGCGLLHHRLREERTYRSREGRQRRCLERLRRGKQGRREGREQGSREGSKQGSRKQRRKWGRTQRQDRKERHLRQELLDRQLHAIRLVDCVDDFQRLEGQLTEKCNHEDTKTRKVRWLSSCLRAFVVAFKQHQELLCGLRGLCVERETSYVVSGFSRTSMPDLS